MMRMKDDSTYYNEAHRDIADLAKNVRATSSCDEMRPLAHNFTPGGYDVICARGKKAHCHPGNRRFRLSVGMNLEKYSKAQSKLDKSLIVSYIVDTVRQNSLDGGFVKFEDGRYFEVGDHIAREKVGQSFRDLLHTKYKSSTKAKKRRRQKQQEDNDSGAESITKTAGSVAEKIQQLAGKVEPKGTNTCVPERRKIDTIGFLMFTLHHVLRSTAAPDTRMKGLFNQANLELLQQIKCEKDDEKVGVLKQVSKPASAVYKQENTVDVEPIRFEDAMSIPGPPALLSYVSMDRVFEGRRDSLQFAMPDLQMSQDLPTGAALTSVLMQSSSDDEAKPEKCEI